MDSSKRKGRVRRVHSFSKTQQDFHTLCPLDVSFPQGAFAKWNCFNHSWTTFWYPEHTFNTRWRLLFESTLFRIKTKKQALLLHHFTRFRFWIKHLLLLLWSAVLFIIIPFHLVWSSKYPSFPVNSFYVWIHASCFKVGGIEWKEKRRAMSILFLIWLWWLYWVISYFLCFHFIFSVTEQEHKSTRAF